MNAILTGASGFLGGHLKAFLQQQGIHVHTLTFRPAQDLEFIAQMRRILQLGETYAVFNVGSSQLSGDDPRALQDLTLSNVFLPGALASVLLQHSPSTPLINFGTSWQIGEHGESSPFNAYAASKSAAEAILEHYALSGLPIASLRLYDTYGPRDSRKKIVNLIADALIHDTELPMSKGEQMIDLVYITDVIGAVVSTVETLRQSPDHALHRYSIRSGKPIRIIDILELLKKLTLKPNFHKLTLGFYPYRSRERFALCPTTPPPNWEPKTDLETGLRIVLQDRGFSFSQQVQSP